jgi:hypothetical protein
VFGVEASKFQPKSPKASKHMEADEEEEDPVVLLKSLQSAIA